MASKFQVLTPDAQYPDGGELRNCVNGEFLRNPRPWR